MRLAGPRVNDLARGQGDAEEEAPLQREHVRFIGLRTHLPGFVLIGIGASFEESATLIARCLFFVSSLPLLFGCAGTGIGSAITMAARNESSVGKNNRRERMASRRCVFCVQFVWGFGHARALPFTN